MSTHNLQAVFRFNKNASRYEAYAQLQARVAADFVEQLAPYLSEQATLLDIGCGTGLLGKALDEAGVSHQRLSCDRAEAMCQQIGSHVAVADMEALPVQSGCCDAVTSSMALHWLADWSVMLAEVQKSLRKQGVFAFAVPIAGTLSLLAESFKQLNKPAALHPFWSEKQVRESLEKAGFKPLHVELRGYQESFATLSDLLHAIKRIGGNHIAGHEPRYPGKNFWRELEQCYRQQSGCADNLLADWHIFMGVYQR